MKKFYAMISLVLVLVLMVPVTCFAAPAEAEVTEMQLRQELLDGNTEHLEAVIAMAYDHLNADIKEDGMTAEIDDDGRICVTQVIETQVNAAGDKIIDYATSKIIVADKNGVEVPPGAEYVGDQVFQRDETLGKYGINIIHTAYASVKKSNGLATSLYVRMKLITTKLTYNNSSYSASKLVQEYNARQAVAFATHTESRTVNNPAAGTHSLGTSTNEWYSPSSGSVGGFMYAHAYVTVDGVTYDICVGTDFDDLSAFSDFL